MGFSRVKAVRLFLAISVFIRWASSQTTVAPDVVGFVVEEGSPITTLSCGGDAGGLVVNTYSDFLFCDFPSESRVGTACDGNGNVLYNTVIQDGETDFVCRDTCITVTVVEDWPDNGKTRSMVDCMSIIGLETAVDTVFRNKPTDLPSDFTESDFEASSTDSRTLSTASESEAVSTTTGDSSNENNNDGGGGGTNTGLIVGAALGSVAGVALIVAAIFVGIRIGRRKAESSEAGGQSQGRKGIREKFKSLPRPTVSVSWAGGAKEGTSEQEKATMLSTGTHNTAAEMEARAIQNPAEVEGESKKTPVEMEARPGEPRAELSVGPDAQGWTGRETNAVPYELDATTRPV
ncbi:Fc.00g079010.m01.CDS01 [Cosmosporella sp. VM-42]